MTRSKASESKATQQSPIFHLLFLCAILALPSCGKVTQYDFKSSDDALGEYEKCWESIRAQKRCDAAQLAGHINQWYECSDTVYKFIQKDPAFTSHVELARVFDGISDSIRMELMRLAGGCTLCDVAYVKLHTSRFSGDSGLDTLKRQAAPFFKNLDKAPIHRQGAGETLSGYSRFLRETRGQAIGSLSGLLGFIRTEDRHFRAFLACMDECSTMGMADITDNTSSICAEIYRAASRTDIPANETLVYMAMRTDRRLLQNARVCHDALKKGRLGDAVHANAYLWMMLQPYLSMDPFAVAMLTDEQSQAMADMAVDYPAIVSLLDDRRLVDRKVSSKIPEQLMRLYISTI